MSTRQTILQYRFINTLTRQQPTTPNTPATITWATMSPLSDYQNHLRGNKIYTYSLHHTKDETEQYISEYKLDSIAHKHDSATNGKWNISKSIVTPLLKQQTVYLDENINEDDQRTIINLRLGVYTFQQACAKCENGTEVTRAHATQCSGVEQRFHRLYSSDYEEYQQSQSQQNITFQDFLLNKMDKFFISRDNKLKALQILTDMVTTAKTIRETVSGFKQSETNRKHWYFTRREQQQDHYYKKTQKQQQQKPLQWHTLLKIRNDPRTSETGRKLNIQEYFERTSSNTEPPVDRHRSENPLPP